MNHTANGSHNSNTGSHSMGMEMPFVFSTDTKITIFFTKWTTSSITQYILTLVFFFLLTIFNRFLGALKFQLEQVWSARESRIQRVELDPRKKRRVPKTKRSPLPVYTHVSGHSEESLPMAHMLDSSMEGNRPQRSFRSWEASGAWSLRKDGTRGLLELGKAFIGYVL